MAKGKAINVKIATPKVINALETKLAQLKQDKASRADKEAKYQKDRDDYDKVVMELALANISKATNVRVNTRYSGEINVDFDLPPNSVNLPDEPVRDYEMIADWQYKDMIEEIENAIRLLKMTDDEVISTSTYNSIARYL